MEIKKDYQSDNLFLLRGWISDISKDKAEGDSTSYAYAFATIRKKQKRLPSSNWEVNDFVLLSCYYCCSIWDSNRTALKSHHIFRFMDKTS